MAVNASSKSSLADGRLAVDRLPPLGGLQAPAVSPREQNDIPVSDRAYQLGNRQHYLPNPKALRPWVDTKSGELDTWPAHASGLVLSSAAAMLSKDKSFIVAREREGGMAPLIPKPRFLQQLENFLKKELIVLGVTEVTPSDLRLQAHREVFEYLIEDFKTYRPLLSAIKNEYEMMLAFQRQQIRQLEPLKQMLVTVSEQCDQKIMNLREQERQEVIDLKTENRNLYAQISMMVNDQKDLQEQVARLQEKLHEEYLKYRDECDARKLLISDINELRYQQEDYLASKQPTSDKGEEEAEDPVLLKVALRKARENEKLASVRLNQMIADYGNVIPLRDFEALEKNFKVIAEQFETVSSDFKKIQAEHEALLDVQKQLTSQRDQFYLELETMKRSATPRPDWDKCADFIQGGMPRWKEMSEGKSSNELVNLLLQEVGTGDVVGGGGAEFFDGQGTGPSIPKYLQYEGSVRNRRLGKRDTALIIRDIWREKSAADAERTDGKRENLGQFLYRYLKNRFSLDQIVVEWGYNLYDACQRYAHDENIGLFWRVLNEEADEEIYHHQLYFIHTLLTKLTKADMQQGNIGNLSRELFQSTLQSALPEIDEEALAIIMKAVDAELDNKEVQEVDYKSFFTEDDEGKTGPFLTEIKKWMEAQKEAYIEEIRDTLQDTSPVTVEDFKRTLSLIDPQIDSQRMDAYVQWAFKVTDDKVENAEPMELSKLLERLHNGNITYAGKT